MGRRRTRIQLSSNQLADLRRRLRATTHPREQERLQTLLDATAGEHTLDDLAQRAGRARATIQLWLGKFARGGIDELLRRDTPPGSESPVGTARVQSQLQAGLKAGRWRSAEEVASWLRQSHGIRRARKSIYYWLAKNGWPAPGAAQRSSAIPPLSGPPSRTSRGS